MHKLLFVALGDCSAHLIVTCKGGTLILENSLCTFHTLLQHKTKGLKDHSYYFFS